jgi:hypothetical protein
MYSKFNENTFQEVNYKTTRSFINLRGYGNILKSTVTDDIKYHNQPFNKLQNLTEPYGIHLPKNAAKVYLEANPQSRISWK